jgi:hypothetical protein
VPKPDVAFNNNEARMISPDLANDVVFTFDGVAYVVSGEVHLGGVIKLPEPDNRYVAITAWNKCVPPTPASIQDLGEIPPCGPRFHHARRQA